jgi:hypothetical protein
MNFIPFDQNLTVSDSFFVAFGLSPYTRVAKDTVGLYYTLADKEERTKYRYGNVAFRWFNKQWYDVLTPERFPTVPPLSTLEICSVVIHLTRSTWLHVRLLILTSTIRP